MNLKKYNFFDITISSMFNLIKFYVRDISLGVNLDQHKLL